MKISRFWSVALATSTFSTFAFAAQEAKAMSFSLDFTNNSLFSGTPSSVNNVDLGVVQVDVNATTRADDNRNLVFNNNGVGIIGNGSNTINGNSGIDNDEVLELNFSKAVRFTSIDFANVNGNDNFTLRIDGDIFDTRNIPINSDPFDFTLPGTDFGTLFEIEARRSNDNFRITSISGEVIPTPALLPGLIGMGAAALRKRRDEATEA